MSVATSWLVMAEYETKQQAEQASSAAIASQPRSYRMVALDRDGNEVWAEDGYEYGARSVRV